MTRDAFALAALNALWLAAGLGVTGAAGWWTRRTVGDVLAFSYLAGLAAYGVLAQLLYVLGFALTWPEIVAVCLVLAAGSVRALRSPARPRLRPARRPQRLVVVLLVAALLVVAAALWLEPLWAYDAWTFWTPKARALAELNGLDVRWFTQPELLNRDYPILLPAIEAAGFRFTGYETPLLDLQSWLIAAAALFAFLEVVAPRAPRWAVVLPLLVVAAPSLADQLASAEADIPLAAFFACAAVCGYLWLTEGSVPALLLCGVFAAATTATKVEGLPFVVALVVVLALASARRPRAAAAIVAVGASAVLVGIVPWRLWVSAHDIPQQAPLSRVVDVSFLAHRAHRVPYSVAYVLEKLFDPRAWIVLVPLLVALTLCAWVGGRRRGAVVVAALVVLPFCALILAYWTSPFELHYHLATSARRVITAPILAWTFLVPLLWAAPVGRPGTLEPT